MGDTARTRDPTIYPDSGDVCVLQSGVETPYGRLRSEVSHLFAPLLLRAELDPESEPTFTTQTQPRPNQACRFSIYRLRCPTGQLQPVHSRSPCVQDSHSWTLRGSKEYPSPEMKRERRDAVRAGVADDRCLLGDRRTVCAGRLSVLRTRNGGTPDTNHKHECALTDGSRRAGNRALL